MSNEVGPERDDVMNNIRPQEEGYSTAQLSGLNDLLTPISEDGEGQGYLNMPEHLKGWSDAEDFYVELEDLTDLPHTPSVGVLNALPWDNYFINLAGSVGNVVQWHGQGEPPPVYVQSHDCDPSDKFPHGALRPLVPVMMFVVDTSPAIPPIDITLPRVEFDLDLPFPEISPVNVTMDLDTLITRLSPFFKPPAVRVRRYSLNKRGSNCLILEKDEDSSDADWIIELDEECLETLFENWLKDQSGTAATHAFVRSGDSFGWMEIKDC